jgi:hypothetical protein
MAVRGCRLLGSIVSGVKAPFNYLTLLWEFHQYENRANAIVVCTSIEKQTSYKRRIYNMQTMSQMQSAVQFGQNKQRGFTAPPQLLQAEQFPAPRT